MGKALSFTTYTWSSLVPSLNLAKYRTEAPYFRPTLSLTITTSVNTITALVEISKFTPELSLTITSVVRFITLKGASVIIPEEATLELSGGGAFVTSCVYEDFLFMIYEKGFIILKYSTLEVYNSFIFTDLNVSSTFTAATANSEGLYITYGLSLGLFKPVNYGSKTALTLASMPSLGSSVDIALEQASLKVIRLGGDLVTGRSSGGPAVGSVYLLRKYGVSSFSGIKWRANAVAFDINDTGLALVNDYNEVWPANTDSLGFIKKEYNSFIGLDVYNDSADFMFRDTTQPEVETGYVYRNNTCIFQLLRNVTGIPIHQVSLGDKLILCGTDPLSRPCLMAFEYINGCIQFLTGLVIPKTGELFKITDTMIAVITYANTGCIITRYNFLGNTFTAFSLPQTIPSIYTDSISLIHRYVQTADGEALMLVTPYSSKTVIATNLQASSVTFTTLPSFIDYLKVATILNYLVLKTSASLSLYKVIGGSLTLLSTTIDPAQGATATSQFLTIEDNYVYMQAGTSTYIFDITGEVLTFLQSKTAFISTESTWNNIEYKNSLGEYHVLSRLGASQGEFGKINTTSHTFETVLVTPGFLGRNVVKLGPYYLNPYTSDMYRLGLEYPLLTISGIVDLKLGKDLFLAVQGEGVRCYNLGTRTYILIDIPNNATLNEIQVSEGATHNTGFLMYRTAVDTGLIDLVTKEL